jgi:spore cortex formation protein SpoVR/YcgB (stage V sporulation)
MSDFTVMTPEQEERSKKLELFYRQIRELARSSNLNQYPLVYEALSGVDPKWNEGRSN